MHVIRVYSFGTMLTLEVSEIQSTNHETLNTAAFNMLLGPNCAERSWQQATTLRFLYDSLVVAAE
jgi:hypothetical protein